MINISFEWHLVDLTSKLTDILVCELMAKSDALWLMFDRLPVHNGMLELL